VLPRISLSRGHNESVGLPREWPLADTTPCFIQDVVAVRRSLAPSHCASIVADIGKPSAVMVRWAMPLRHAKSKGTCTELPWPARLGSDPVPIPRNLSAACHLNLALVWRDQERLAIRKRACKDPTPDNCLQERYSEGGQILPRGWHTPSPRRCDSTADPHCNPPFLSQRSRVLPSERELPEPAPTDRPLPWPARSLASSSYQYGRRRLLQPLLGLPFLGLYRSTFQLPLTTNP
jgi:hypothetical protein